MTRALRFCSLVLIVFVSACCRNAPLPAISQPQVTPTEPAIAFVTVGEQDQVLIKRLCEYLTHELKARVRLKESQPGLTGALETQAEKLASLLSQKDVLLLALAAEPKDIRAHGAVCNKVNTAVINISALNPQATDDPLKDAERYARRVEKESMRAIGHLLGMESCPDPRCAMSTYATEEQLDAKGRNFCPPCQGKCRAVLEAKGVKIVKPASNP